MPAVPTRSSSSVRTIQSQLLKLFAHSGLPDAMDPGDVKGVTTGGFRCTGLGGGGIATGLGGVGFCHDVTLVTLL